MATGVGPESASAPEPESWDDIVLDEDFIARADVTEPSGRARMLAARWRDRPPEAQPWRACEPPPGGFRGRSRRRRP
ncbi:SGM_3592 family protein [Streptomyces sp. NPDC002004]